MTKWEAFFKEKIKKIFREKKRIIDIGGSLRLDKKQGNRFDKKNNWIISLKEQVRYEILDKVPDYNPDIVGDIHHLPFADNSQEAILCLAVLEHVENPIKACEELYRVLMVGGYCFVYVPFLYYYHAEKGYYGDYWRFTPDSLGFLFKNFKAIELMPVRGAIETWIKLSPIGRIKILKPFWYFLDKVSGKLESKQVSGYYAFLIK